MSRKQITYVSKQEIPSMKKKKILAMVFLAAIVAGVCGLIRIYLPFRAYQQELENREYKKLVDDYQTISYPGKSMGEVSLSHYTKEEITDLLRKEIEPYQKCIASILLNTDEHTYSMQDLGQRIYYRCSNKRTFKAGDEKRLASYLVNMDKKRSLKEQYDIIKGTIEATQIDVTIQCECNEKALKRFITNLEKEYSIQPENSRIDKNFNVHPAKLGRVLDTANLKKELRTYLNRQTTKNFKGSYHTYTVKPEWYPEDMKKVNTLITRHQTSFQNNTPRGYNIRLAAKRLNGKCLFPGERISFLKVLYDDSDKKSYKKSGAYFKGKIVQAEGGGICQVSTTAYHAFLLAGIVPEKRFPHSMPVGYAKLGLDAALSVGGKDLVIENKWDVPLLILAEAKNGELAVAIQSYKNVLDGYTYKPAAKKISGLEAEASLNVYKGKKKVKTIALSHDVYEKRAD